jgi:Transposase DDE domain
VIRSALRGLLRAADEALRAVLHSGDDYASAAKPQIDWDAAEARAALIESRAQDALACLALLADREVTPELREAMTLLATVTGQDLETDADGHMRIARRVARDRVLSTVDPEARHGHKTAAHSFDGYKGHIAIDPDSELITAAVVTAGNAGDASVAAALISDVRAPAVDAAAPATSTGNPEASTGDGPARAAAGAVVYGDQAYGSGAFQELLADAGIESRYKTPRPTAPGGMFAKDRFAIDLEAGSVTCPAGVTVVLGRARDGGGTAHFGTVCASCPLRAECTAAPGGRTISVGSHETALAAARARQADPAWADDYRNTRPKVERKLAHLVRRKHGGRHARVRGTISIGRDFRWLAAAVNLARLAVLGLHGLPAGGWAAA